MKTVPSKQYMFRFSVDLMNKIDSLASDQRASRSDVVRNALHMLLHSLGRE